MPTWFWWGSAVAVAGLAVGGFGLRELNRQFVAPAPAPPLPPLLIGATARGGRFYGCEATERIQSNPQSPEIADRLKSLAPIGSSSIELQAALRVQGFSDGIPCTNAPDIFHADFRQKRGGGLTYAAAATIWWAVDDDGRILWTNGRIFYSGL
ncbi:hypothetical protein [Sphingomonas bacterium]|uniref:hypothetical protein n=1 Tax=Sphingomonas bacterium TaxID=1895847 RepID=UPI0015763B95|nr:hypothetical protein [Sphingomonas bacterium]